MAMSHGRHVQLKFFLDGAYIMWIKTKIKKRVNEMTCNISVIA